MRRNYPAGVHGVKGRGKRTAFGRQLQEKQKARYTYGILERQFHRYYDTAIKRREATDLLMMQLLETRLDNVVFRLGLAKTRAAARQLVGHGHVKVNDKKVDIPSYQVKAGQTIGIGGGRERIKRANVVTTGARTDATKYWYEFNRWILF